MAHNIAVRAHIGQQDKSGAPYIEHPARVAVRVRSDPSAEAVAWLHDVVEDTDQTLDDLRAAGIPEPVVVAVDAISKRHDEDRDTYCARVAANPLALKVKHADMADNTDPVRLAKLDPVMRARLEAKDRHAQQIFATRVVR